jgi:hypothetical protein
MKTKEKSNKKRNWTLPGEPLSDKEVEKGIKKSEKGPFYTIEESKKIIEEWRIKRNSK